jgi:hypothetical protein
VNRLAHLLGPSPAAVALAAGGRLVVAGQQPAYGCGPLYTLLKAAHAVALARSLNRPAAPVAALFWSASEDHDLGEADHLDLLQRDGRILRLTADFAGGRQALRHRPAATGWDALIHELERLSPHGLGRAWVTTHAPRPDELLGAWQCRILTGLLADLTAIEAHRLRPLWREGLARALTAWPEQALAAHRAAHLAAGGSDPFGPLTQAPVFADRSAGRTPLDPDQALQLFAHEPEVLSPGAALRPILQQVALPCSHFIAGPGELAYHALLTPLYSHFGVEAPVLVPRCRATLIPSWFRRACASRGWEVAALPTREPPLDPSALADLDAAINRLRGAHPDVPGHLARLTSARDRLAKALHRQVHPTRLGALRAWIEPRAKPQERVLSIIQAVWEFGPGLAQALVDHAADEQRGQWLQV